MARIGQDNSPRNRFLAGAAVVAVALGGAVVMNQPDVVEPVQQKVTIVDDRIASDGFEGEGGGGAPVPPIEPPVEPGACPAPPPGFGEVRKEWPLAWAYGYPCSPRALCERNPHPYSAGQSYPAPLGADTGTYKVIPFVPRPNHAVNLYFDGVQSRPQIAYQQRPAVGMLMAVSRCAGAFPGPGVDMDARCWIYASAGSLVWSSQGQPAACPVTPGEQYFLNIIPANPEGGIQPGESSCAIGVQSGCDVGAVTQSS